MTHCHDQGVDGVVGVDNAELDAVFVKLDLLGVGPGLGHDHVHVPALEFVDEVDDLACCGCRAQFSLKVTPSMPTVLRETSMPLFSMNLTTLRAA